MTKVILVRHGRTTYNQQGRYQGSSDESVLTEQGYRDAYSTGIALEQCKFDAISTSPLKRVQQTTEVIVAALKESTTAPPVFIESMLTEVCMSDWQGLFYQEVKEKFPQAYKCWQLTPHLFTRDCLTYPVRELYKQAENFWQKILNKHRGQTILIVAHGGTNRALIGTAICSKPENYHSLQQSNCGISCLEFSSLDGYKGKLKYLNYTMHLGENLPKLKAGKTGWRWLLMSNRLTKNIRTSFLSEIFEQENINMVLSDNTLSSNLLATSLVNRDCQAVHLSINRHNFIEDWYNTIVKKQEITTDSIRYKLFSGLIIASDNLLSQILFQTTKTDTPLEIANNLAVVHYPQTQKQSILQGMLPLDRSLVT